jgi:predicted RecB family nuclease
MEAKTNLKTCNKGHRFYKSSDCPVCLICEEERKPKDNFLSLLVAPARRALENNGIKTLEQLSKYAEEDVLSFHGMGKSTISNCKDCWPKVDCVLRINNNYIPK